MGLQLFILTERGLCSINMDNYSEPTLPVTVISKGGREEVSETEEACVLGGQGVR